MATYGPENVFVLGWFRLQSSPKLVQLADSEVITTLWYYSPMSCFGLTFLHFGPLYFLPPMLWGMFDPAELISATTPVQNTTSTFLIQRNEVLCIREC
jgi:hypothetical protein